MPNKMQFFHWPDGKGITLNAGFNRHRELSDFYEGGDFENVNDNWRRQVDSGNNSFSKRTGSLFRVDKYEDNIVASYIGTEYKVYNAISFPHPESKAVSKKLTDKMRLSCIGGIIDTLDDKILVQRRSEKVIAGGKLDAGVSGVCIVEESNEMLYFDLALDKILKRELNIVSEEIISTRQTSLFSNMGYENTGMVGYTVKVGLEFGKLNERINKNYVSELVPINKRELIPFIIEHYTQKKDMINDGCAALLSAMEPVEFMEAVKELRKRGESIEFGTLDDGVFVPN